MSICLMLYLASIRMLQPNEVNNLFFLKKNVSLINRRVSRAFGISRSLQTRDSLKTTGELTNQHIKADAAS